MFYLERGGKTALTFTASGGRIEAVDRDAMAGAIVETCRRGRLDDFVLEFVDGERVSHSPWAAALRRAGFNLTPRGLGYARPAV